MFGMYPGLQEKKNKSKKIKKNPKQTAFIFFAVIITIIFLVPPMDYHTVEFYSGRPYDEAKFSGFDFIFNLHGSYRINYPIWIVEFILAGLIYVGYLKTRN
jgi:hypothetical protein